MGKICLRIGAVWPRLFELSTWVNLISRVVKRDLFVSKGFRFVSNRNSDDGFFSCFLDLEIESLSNNDDILELVYNMARYPVLYAT